MRQNVCIDGKSLTTTEADINQHFYTLVLTFQSFANELEV